MNPLRGCLKTRSSGEPPQHKPGHGDRDHRLATGRQSLRVLTQAPVANQPAESTFPHPSPGQDDKALLRVAAPDRAQEKAKAFSDPIEQLSPIVAIDPDQG